MTLIFILLVAFQAKHFIADYILQNKYMLGKFAPDWGFFFPLLAHASVHGAFTLMFCLVICPSLWWLSIVDIVSHFIVDRIKAGPKYLGRFKALSAYEFCDLKWILNEAAKYKASPDSYVEGCEQYVREKEQEALTRIRNNTIFWWALGADQLAHHLVHYWFIYMLITGV